MKGFFFTSDGILAMAIAVIIIGASAALLVTSGGESSISAVLHAKAASLANVNYLMGGNGLEDNSGTTIATCREIREMDLASGGTTVKVRKCMKIN